jgi:hypothetical protein
MVEVEPPVAEEEDVGARLVVVDEPMLVVARVVEAEGQLVLLQS